MLTKNTTKIEKKDYDLFKVSDIEISVLVAADL